MWSFPCLAYSAARVVVLFARRFSCAVASFEGSTCSCPSQNHTWECAEDSAAELPRYRRVAAQTEGRAHEPQTRRSGRKEPRSRNTLSSVAPATDKMISAAILPRFQIGMRKARLTAAPLLLSDANMPLWRKAFDVVLQRNLVTAKDRFECTIGSLNYFRRSSLANNNYSIIPPRSVAITMGGSSYRDKTSIVCKALSTRFKC